MQIRQTKPGNLPFVTLYHGSKPYNFIIDTGSTLSWTTPEVLGKMILDKEVSTHNKVVSVTLRVEPSTGTDNDYTMRKFQVKLHCGVGSDKINDMNNHVKESVHGILGMDFLEHNAIKLNMKTFRLYL